MLQKNQSQKNQNSLMVIILFFTLLLSGLNTALAQDEECDINIDHSTTNPLCVPSIAIEDDYALDGDKVDWLTDNRYAFGNFLGTGHNAQVLVSHKKRSFTEVDLFLFFETHDDAVPTFSDEIRIGLNSANNPNKNILIKIFPWKPTLSSSYTVEVYNYNGGTNTWNPISTAWLPAGNIFPYKNEVTEYWSLEMKIPLDAIPTHPLTGADFRLYLELHVDDGMSTVTYPWPTHYVFGEHNYICTNPQRWYPMSFGTDCYPDLHIANGLYSCDAIYILRNGVKSKEIVVNQENEFHADVTYIPNTQGLEKDATDVQVYMTLLKLGISSAPIAMNYDHTDVNVKNWFEKQWGTWLLATDQLDTGYPKPPDTFTINSTNSPNPDWRFKWRPSDETSFGDQAGMVGSHKCAAAFVYYKDDPNMSNNFSYCNTTIVDCPSGEVCSLPFWAGPYFAYAHPPGEYYQRFQISGFNEPYEGWFEQADVQITGQGVKQIDRYIFNVPVPRDTMVGLNFIIKTPKPPRTGYIKKSALLDLSPLQQSSRDPARDREERLRRIYDNRPLILIEGFIPSSYKTGAGKDSLVQLYRSTSYVAFALDLQEPPCACNPTEPLGMLISSLILTVGLTFTGLYVRNKKNKNG
jgi:hypothetical protein